MIDIEKLKQISNTLSDCLTQIGIISSQYQNMEEVVSKRENVGVGIKGAEASEKITLYQQAQQLIANIDTQLSTGQNRILDVLPTVAPAA